MVRKATQIGGGPAFVIEESDTYESYQQSLRNYREKLVTKWGWLLEGRKRDHLKPIPEHLYPSMAMLFENQQAVSRGLIHEATTSTDLTMPSTFALPLIRKIYPELFALRIASIQPLPLSSGGTGTIFFQDFVREDGGNTSLTTGDSDYAVGAENSVPKRIKMTITSAAITTTKDILAATWSTEVAEDARGTLGLDIESELITNAANEIIRETDERVLRAILDNAAAGNTDWHYTMPVGAVYPPKDHYESLFHACIDTESLIFAARYRRADYIVAGRNVVSYLRKAADFKPAPRTQPMPGQPFAVGVEFMGELTGNWDVYQAHYSWMDNIGIMGVYPRSMTDAGYIYCPYIPLSPMPLVYAEFKPYNDATMPGAYVNTDKWSRNIRTRHGHRAVVPEYFGTVTISA
jgi:hypothetical protein